MKKLIRVAAILIGAAATGILVWRKVEADNLRNDLWAEAEKVEVDKTPRPASSKTQPVPAPRS
ncbi:DLW-39 family protein [Brachybacterium sp. DNPG3]